MVIKSYYYRNYYIIKMSKLIIITDDWLQSKAIGGGNGIPVYRLF